MRMVSDKRRTHSTMDTLPKEILGKLSRMIFDGTWPRDYVGDKIGKPTYEDMAEYTRQRGRPVSKYAIGRYCRRHKTLARMKEAGLTVRQALKNYDGSQASATQKAGAEMLTATIIELLTAKETFTAKEIKQLSGAVGDCNRVVLAHEKYVKELARKQIKADLKKVEGLRSRKQISPETLKAIREQVYGIVDNHLGLKSS